VSAGSATTPSGPAGRILRFGPFEFDPQTGELRKHGLRIKLQGQPIAILGMLLDHPGEVVTREDLQHRLWPADTYVDFDRSLNAAVKRLRAALNDSADSPRFVETLARRGYRFIAPLAMSVPAPVAQPATAPVEPETPHRRMRVRTAIAILILTAAAAFVVRVALRRADPAPVSIRSLVVLPLANLSGDRDQDYFADGMTDALRQQLEPISALRVISRTSSMRYRGSGKSLPEIARELNVDGAIEGSILRSGDRVRITIELVQTATERRLWGQTFDRDLKDIFALQSAVASRIAEKIRVTLTAPDRARLAAARAADPEAYLAYSRGRFLWSKRTEADMRKAIGQFQDAVRRDPAYARAYVGLADCWAALGWYAYLSPAETFPHARDAVKQALVLDESMADAHTTLAFLDLYYDRDWAEAEREFRRAIDLNPNYANAHHWYAEYLSLMGRHDRAIAESLRARELDPISSIITAWVGSRYFFARQYDKAIEQYRSAVEMDPHFVPARLVLGHAYEQKGMLREAIAEFETAVELSERSPVYVASLAHAYGIAGERFQAERLLDELRRTSARKYVSSYDLALVSLGLGREEEALTLLEQAVGERSPRVAFLNVEPRFDGIRSGARFRQLVARLGLPR
jgi:TolB-like protein/DNA-binding winged helix-turn-helix (wHTH) protein/Tfp pilus assembly protein PilF